MCELYKNIEALCERCGIKIADLSRETNLSKSLFSDLKREKTKYLSVEKLIIVADYFDVSLDDLVSRKRKTSDTEVSEVDKKIFERLNAMSDEQKDLFLNLSEQLIQPKSKD